MRATRGLTLLAFLLLLSACVGRGEAFAIRGEAFAGPDPGGGFPCRNNAFEDCARP